MADDDFVNCALLSVFLCFSCWLNEPGGRFGGGGPKMCKTRVLGVLGV
jgi:hypothetical protein